MIRCSKCGTVNKADASFCSECNAYLEWSGEKVQADEPPEAPAPASRDKPPAEPPPPATDASPVRQAPPSAAPQPEARKPERSSVAPRPKPKAAAPREVERPKPGELICGSCGTGNDPQRKFCRRCGSSLVEATVEPTPEPKRAPWYKRIFRRGNAPAAYEAGARPDHIGRRRRRPGCLLIVVITLIIVIVAAGLAYALHDGTRSAVDDTVRTARCRILEQLDEPTQASIAIPARGQYGYPAFDNFDETTWRATETNDLGAYVLEVRLDKPGFVHRVEITPAEAEPRPDIVRIHDEGRVVARGELDNSGDSQVIEICRDLARFHLRVVTTYPEEAGSVGIRRIVVRVRP
jgi:hypothetical protein